MRGVRLTLGSFIYLAASVVFMMGCMPSTKPSTVAQAPQENREVNPLDALTVPPIPEWTDRYADGKKGDVRFFNISRLMDTYQLSRVQAVELQNQYRDLTRTDANMIGQTGFDRALSAVRASSFESRLDVEGLKAAKFVVVFDLDDTLFDQYYGGGESCNTHSYVKADGKTKYVYMIPGWDAIIKEINTLGGKVVIFSANLDDRTIELLSHVKLDGVPITKSKLISGIMTNSFLIQQEKTERPGSADKPRKGRPVIEPSKDMRFFDESLSKVVIVDDNPLRLFQFRNVRVFKKFHADHYCTTKNAIEKRAIEKGMGVVAKEIRWAAAQVERNPKLGFARAYLPFTALGEITVSWLRSTHDWDAEKAWLYVVEHPEMVDQRF